MTRGRVGLPIAWQWRSSLATWTEALLLPLGGLSPAAAVGIWLLAALLPWAAGHWLLIRPLRIDVATLQGAHDDLALRQAALAGQAARHERQVRELGQLERALRAAMDSAGRLESAEEMAGRLSQLARDGELVIQRLHIHTHGQASPAGQPVLQLHLAGRFGPLAAFVEAMVAMAVPGQMAIERLEVERAQGHGESADPLLGLDARLRLVSPASTELSTPGALDREQAQ